MNPELDAKLSALLDGELPAAEASALRAEIARSPELAERLAALAGVDEQLRALPAPPVPASLRARIARELGAGSAQARRDAAPRRAPGRTRRWLAAAALAAAAAALVFLVTTRAPEPEAQLAEAPPVPAPAPPTPAPAPEVAPPPAPLSAPAPPLEVARAPEPAPLPSSEAEELAEADLPVIEVLDVLAELDELEASSG